jgi:hypothetical protein
MLVDISTGIPVLGWHDDATGDDIEAWLRSDDLPKNQQADAQAQIVTTRDWVALDTWADEPAGVLYEAGGVYRKKPRCKFADPTRALRPGEPTARCPQCGQSFVATDDGSAEANRDLHVTGDEDSPSICGTTGQAR